ncbi:MAG: LOG family protein [Candidatus Harrisonbacteria bacterium]|nr:LOG family protein [Candidatus Harrisonbacteria bacterium]
MIGLSPAASEAAHLKTYRLPVDYHDLIIYTGFDYSGRNLLLTRSSDAIITICGRMGTLNEFTIAFEDQKPIGIFEGTGGTADMMRDILEKSHRGMGHVVFASDAKTLLDLVVQAIDEGKGNHYVEGHVRG